MKAVLKNCNCRICGNVHDGECLWLRNHCIATIRVKRLRNHERFFCNRFIKKHVSLSLFDDV